CRRPRRSGTPGCKRSGPAAHLARPAHQPQHDHRRHHGTRHRRSPARPRPAAACRARPGGGGGMGVGRKAPHRTRAAYAAALNEIPLPVRAISAPVAEALTVLDQTEIDGRTVQYGTLATAPRLWVALADTTPPVLGYLTG